MITWTHFQLLIRTKIIFIQVSEPRASIHSNGTVSRKALVALVHIAKDFRNSSAGGTYLLQVRRRCHSRRTPNLVHTLAFLSVRVSLHLYSTKWGYTLTGPLKNCVEDLLINKVIVQVATALLTLPAVLDWLFSTTVIFIHTMYQSRMLMILSAVQYL